jgi:hypothetical protein
VAQSCHVDLFLAFNALEVRRRKESDHFAARLDCTIDRILPDFAGFDRVPVIEQLEIRVLRAERLTDNIDRAAPQ